MAGKREKVDTLHRERKAACLTGSLKLVCFESWARKRRADRIDSQDNEAAVSRLRANEGRARDLQVKRRLKAGCRSHEMSLTSRVDDQGLGEGLTGVSEMEQRREEATMACSGTVRLTLVSDSCRDVGADSAVAPLFVHYLTRNLLVPLTGPTLFEDWRRDSLQRRQGVQGARKYARRENSDETCAVRSISHILLPHTESGALSSTLFPSTYNHLLIPTNQPRIRRLETQNAEPKRCNMASVHARVAGNAHHHTLTMHCHFSLADCRPPIWPSASYPAITKISPRLEITGVGSTIFL